MDSITLPCSSGLQPHEEKRASRIWTLLTSWDGKLLMCLCGRFGVVSEENFETGVDCSAKDLYVLKVTGQQNKGQIGLQEHALGCVQVYWYRREPINLSHFLSKKQ